MESTGRTTEIEVDPGGQPLLTSYVNSIIVAAFAGIMLSQILLGVPLISAGCPCSWAKEYEKEDFRQAEMVGSRAETPLVEARSRHSGDQPADSTLIHCFSYTQHKLG